MQIYFAIKESRPEGCSSSRITLGSAINTTPIEHRFLSPPDIIFSGGVADYSILTLFKAQLFEELFDLMILHLSGRVYAKLA